MRSCDDPVLLTTGQMSAADRLSVAAGTPEAILMDRAGWAVAEAALDMLDGRKGLVIVLCGPGNNGGDGFVAARRLRALGRAVVVALLGDPAGLRGEAAAAARGWPEQVADASTVALNGAALLVDALFGAGLSRDLTGAAAALVTRINDAGVPVLAVDVPSGIDGNTGAVRGKAVVAGRTVTFFRYKPGHLLLPGRSHCGTRMLADIGIDPDVLKGIAPDAFANTPALWGAAFPWPTAAGHKYSRGHAVVLSGGATTSGAARMSARAALRIGAGLVTLAAPTAALAVCATQLTAVMLKACDDIAALAGILADRRRNVVVLGPGLGVGEATRALVGEALRRPAEPGGPPRAVVIDADGLTSFAGQADALSALVATAPGPVVVTPHDGEFEKLFGPDIRGSRLDRAREGARRLGTTVLLKGPDTVVAEPGGRASIAAEDAPMLATAGSGDVLSGLVVGLLAQAMPAFEAASAAVALHAAAARRVGYGLIAEDLPEALPGALGALHAALNPPQTTSNQLRSPAAAWSNSADSISHLPGLSATKAT